MSVISSVKKVLVGDGCKIFYREAGCTNKPTILLLHGFPTSSNMFRNLIPLLASHFHVIAPDFPGFGFTEVPSSFEYTFSNLTDSIDHFVRALKLTKFALYAFDYGGPIGFRLALKDPARVTGLVIQNGNAYEEGLGEEFWSPLKQYWKTEKENPEFVEPLSKFLEDPKNIVSQYVDGVEDPDSIDPAAYSLDAALLNRPGQTGIQLSLFYDYQTNLSMYPQFQDYLKSSHIPILLTWGKNDTLFTVEGAEAYRRDVKNLRVVYFNSGHFALESHVEEISEEIIEFLVPQLL